MSVTLNLISVIWEGLYPEERSTKESKQTDGPVIVGANNWGAYDLHLRNRKYVMCFYQVSV